MKMLRNRFHLILLRSAESKNGSRPQSVAAIKTSPEIIGSCKHTVSEQPTSRGSMMWYSKMSKWSEKDCLRLILAEILVSILCNKLFLIKSDIALLFGRITD